MGSEYKALLLCKDSVVDHLVANGCKTIADSLLSKKLITPDYSSIQLDTTEPE